MSMQTLERAVLAEAKQVVNNPKLRLKDIMEWSTSEKSVKGNCEAGEVVFHLPELGVWICINQAHDRTSPTSTTPKRKRRM